MHSTNHGKAVCRGVLPLLVIAAATPVFATDFLNLKGYYDSATRREFNYSGEDVISQSLGTGRTRVSFPGLHVWTYLPTLQVTPRTNHSNGYDVCSAQFSQSPHAAVVVDVTCKRGGNPFSTGFVLMILDVSSDAGMPTLTRQRRA